MKLRSVAVKNVNGITGTINLTGRDILLGPNGVGKSTYLKAIRISILGRDPDPRLGSQPITLRRLASGEDMTFGLEAGEGDRTFAVARIYREDAGKGSQVMAVVPSHGEKGTTEMQARIAEELGDFPLQFDEGVFRSLSPAGKRDFIFQLFAAGHSVGADDIAGRLELREPKDISDDDRETRQALIRTIIREWDTSRSFVENFNILIAALKSKVSGQKKLSAEADAASRRLLDLKNQYGDRGNLNLSELDKEIGELQEKVEVMGREIAGSEERIRSIERLERDIVALKEKIGQRQHFTDDDALRLAEIKDRRAEINSPALGEENKQIALKRIEIEKKISVHNTLIDAIRRSDTEIARLQREHDALPPLPPEGAKRFGELVGIIAAAEKTLIATRASILAAGKCPVGKTDCSDLKKAKNQADLLSARAAEQEMKLDALRGEKVALGVALEAEKSRTHLSGDIQRAKDGREELVKQAADISGSLSLLKALNDRLSETDPLILEDGALATEAAKLEKKAEDSAIRDGYEKELSGKQAALQNMGAVADIEILRGQVQSGRAKLAALRTDRQAKSEAKLAWEQAEQAVMDRDRIEAEAKVAKELETSLGPKGIQGEIVQEMMKPLSEQVQALLGDSDMRFDCQMQDSKGKEIFDIGFRRGDDQFITVPSGGEQVLFNAAFLTALVVAANPKNKTLLFEMAECDQTKTLKFLERMGGYVEKGILDNVVVAHYQDIQPPAGWTIHRLPVTA